MDRRGFVGSLFLSGYSESSEASGADVSAGVVWVFEELCWFDDPAHEVELDGVSVVELWGFAAVADRLCDHGMAEIALYWCDLHFVVTPLKKGR